MMQDDVVGYILLLEVTMRFDATHSPKPHPTHRPVVKERSPTHTMVTTRLTRRLHAVYLSPARQLLPSASHLVNYGHETFIFPRLAQHHVPVFQEVLRCGPVGLRHNRQFPAGILCFSFRLGQNLCVFSKASCNWCFLNS